MDILNLVICLTLITGWTAAVLWCICSLIVLIDEDRKRQKVKKHGR